MGWGSFTGKAKGQNVHGVGSDTGKSGNVDYIYTDANGDSITVLDNGQEAKTDNLRDDHDGS